MTLFERGVSRDLTDSKHLRGVAEMTPWGPRWFKGLYVIAALQLALTVTFATPRSVLSQEDTEVMSQEEVLLQVELEECSETDFPSPSVYRSTMEDGTPMRASPHPDAPILGKWLPNTVLTGECFRIVPISRKTIRGEIFEGQTTGVFVYSGEERGWVILLSDKLVVYRPPDSPIED